MADNTYSESHTPTMSPQTGLRSSSALIDYGIKVGHVVVHRRPVEALLSNLPSGVKRMVVKGVSQISSRVMLPETELQEAMNGKLFMSTVDAETGKALFEEAPEGYLKSLFPQGEQDKWPTQVAICTKDVRPDPAFLRKIMLNLEEMVSDVVGPLPVVGGYEQDAAGKTVVLGVYDTEDNIFSNASAVMDRVHTLKQNPLSLDGITRAAQAVGDMLLETATLKHDGPRTILRADTADIFRHIMTHGFSQGGNIATDIFRYIRHQLRDGPYELAMDAQGQDTLPIRTDQDIKPLLEGAHVFVIAAADPAYSKDELDVLPPRDHHRSDGDIIISAAVGVNTKQANYGARWQQHNPHLERNDRFLEAIGPKKKWGGLRERVGGYHSYRGHGVDQYRRSVVDTHRDELAERWLPRFKNQVVVEDITFHQDTVELHFAAGTKIDTMTAATEKLSEHLRAHAGIEVETDVFPPNPHHVQMRATPTEDVLNHIHNALTEAGATKVPEVKYALDVETMTGWLQRHMQNAPPMEIELDITHEGPHLLLTPSNDMGPHMHKIVDKSLENAGFKPKHYRQENGDIALPIHDVVEAIKAEMAQTREESMMR